MKTTELYIEQVIIGFLVLAIVAVPWAPELKQRLGEINIAEGSVLLGVAFLLGIPFDRLADTLSERLDRHNRLLFALGKRVGDKFPKPKQAPEHNKLDEDLFAEDQFRREALRETDAMVNWIEYHRSRIRIVRALAVYGPALTFSLTLSMTRVDSNIGMSALEIGIWLSAVAAAYVIWAMIASPPEILRKESKHSESSEKCEEKIDKVRFHRAVFGDELPRTDQKCFLTYAKKWDAVDAAGIVQKTTPGSLVWLDEWRILVVPVLVLIAALLFGFIYTPETAWVAVCGGLVTVISTWSWWRISITYRTYLYDLGNKKRTGGSEFI